MVMDTQISGRARREIDSLNRMICTRRASLAAFDELIADRAGAKIEFELLQVRRRLAGLIERLVAQRDELLAGADADLRAAAMDRMLEDAEWQTAHVVDGEWMPPVDVIDQRNREDESQPQREFSDCW